MVSAVCAGQKTYDKVRRSNCIGICSPTPTSTKLEAGEQQSGEEEDDETLDANGNPPGGDDAVAEKHVAS